MQDTNPIRGFKDIIDRDFEYSNLYNTCLKIAKQNCYYEAISPVLEKSSLFERGMGEDSDAASKELYKFTFHGESLALRPEFTAGIARMIVNYPEFINGHTEKTGLNLFSFAPVFRHDRPQAGRYRQFFQANFECFKNQDISCDFSAINLTITIVEKYLNLEACIKDVKNLGLKIKIKINSLGSLATKNLYAQKLSDYLLKHESNLSVDSKKRLKINPIRILDSKDENDKKIIASAPLINSVWSKEEECNFKSLCRSLEASIDPRFQDFIVIEQDLRLVRGLDYYTSTVFEVVPSFNDQDELTIFAGGRYDNLISQLSSNAYSLPAFGFACGVERLIEFKKDIYNKLYLASNDGTKKIKLAVILMLPKDELAKQEAYPKFLHLANKLKNNDIPNLIANDTKANSYQYSSQIIIANKLATSIEQCSSDGFTHQIVIGQKEADNFTVKEDGSYNYQINKIKKLNDSNPKSTTQEIIIVKCDINGNTSFTSQSRGLKIKNISEIFVA
jgi:histidyl-tRNA synthetase